MMSFSSNFFKTRVNAGVTKSQGGNGEMTLLVHCLYKMLPLNHKRTASSLAPPIFYVAKNSAIKR